MPEVEMTQARETVPACKWTNGGDEVLILKCLPADGIARGSRDARFVAKYGANYEFQWPLTVGATIEADDWDSAPECGGGFHGWPWGLAIGDGKEPDWSNGRWIVYGAKPADVVDIAGKCKSRTATIRFVAPVGQWWTATAFVLSGQMNWVHFNASGAASATGASGAASATGESGAASATGWSGAASATGWSGAASATGESGAASATGWSGAASATGASGAAISTGWRGAASATGESGAASATGWSGAASATGESGAASATGWRGAASATGESGAASATGESGAASATGESGAASATGWRGAAISTGEYATVEAGPNGLAASTANEVTWIVRPGAVFVHRWAGGVKFATPEGLKAVDGERITFRCGKIIKRVRP